MVLAPTAKNQKRTLLERHLADYTAKFSFDYFVHKDLGGFLRREMDFFIKNEIIFIDDLDAEHIKASISKAKVIKQVGFKVIEFLKQLEDFQKRIWLKKKFVVEAGYCFTLDMVDEQFYPEIIKNKEQVEEWIKIYSINEISGDLHVEKFSNPLTVEFLRQNSFLVLDTKYFNSEFVENLIASIDFYDRELNGLLVNSENFQAISLIENRYLGQIKTVYIDPPYNTEDDGFSYKDNYKHSTWMTMMNQTLSKSRSVLRNDSLYFSSIDRDENRNLLPLFFNIFGQDNFVEEIVWQKAYGGGSKTRLINNLHEYVICFSENKNELPKLWLPPDPEVQKYYKYSDSKIESRGKFRTQPLYTNSNDYRENLTYPLPVPIGCQPGSSEWDSGLEDIRNLLTSEDLILEGPEGGWRFLLLKDNRASLWEGGLINPPKQWQWSWERTRNAIINDELVFSYDGVNFTVDYKQYQLMEDGTPRGKKPSSIQIGPYTQSGTSEIKNLFNYEAIKFPKPTGLLKNILAIDYVDSDAIFADWFAGSGTTGQGVIELNRENGGNRKYVLVEMGDHFENVLKPRIQKIIYSKDWKDGKPVSREGSSHMFKYIRLESYEDALNNLRLKRTQVQQELIDQKDPLREQYMLSYMLDVESAGSVSLLNVDGFKDPFNYRMNIARGSETKETVVDLVETFNWLLGIKVLRISAREYRTADFERNAEDRLQIKDRARTCSAGDGWTFKEVEGETLAGEKVMIIWRTLTDNPEQDNLMLDAWFSKRNYSTLDFEFSRIYVNGDNNLENLKIGEERWKVALIEEEFKRLMFSVEG